MNKVTTPVARLSFPALWEAKSFKNKDGSITEPKFEATLLFPVTADLNPMKVLAQQALEERWPKGPPSGFRSPFRNGNEKEDVEGYAGTIFVKVSSKRRPMIVDINLQQIINKDLVYAGCYVRASVNCFAYDHMGNRGVAFGLLGLQMVRDGEAFGVVSDPEKDFFDSPAIASQQGIDAFGFGANVAPAAPAEPFKF